MADGLNVCFLLGNLGADPELRMTSSGAAVMNLRLATTRSYLDKNKARQENTEWHTVVVWGRRAEGLAKILKKGTRLHVTGEIRYERYEDKEGNEKWRTSIHAQNVTLCERAPAGSNPRNEYGDDDFVPPTGGDDIPF